MKENMLMMLSFTLCFSSHCTISCNDNRRWNAIRPDDNYLIGDFFANGINIYNFTAIKVACYFFTAAIIKVPLNPAKLSI